jgi:SAM-dependent methyltransferase
MDPILSQPAAGAVADTPRDRPGAETLEIMAAAPRYNIWQYSRIAPFLGRRVCEIGAGIGNMSALLTHHRPELLLLTDTDPYYRDLLHRKFLGHPGARVEALTLPDEDAAGRFGEFRLDTVVALNVIEHIEEDVAAMRSMRDMLIPGGQAIVLVPALRWLYGSLDRELGHARRYARRELRTRMEQAGLRVERLFYFNLVGTLGWFMNARIRRVPRIPLNQLRLFDAVVPVLRLEDAIPLPFGQSLIAVGVRDA